MVTACIPRSYHEKKNLPPSERVKFGRGFSFLFSVSRGSSSDDKCNFLLLTAQFTISTILSVGKGV